MELNLKGQAAITDAMYFLIIVMALTTFTYAFVLPYGQSVDLHLNKEFRQSYASSAVKAILYSSVSRIPDESISETSEVDYLLTLIKEDYAEKTSDSSVQSITLSEPTKKVLSKNVYHAMNFLTPSFDYVFFIRSLEPKEYLFVFFKIAYVADDEATAAFFYCEPSTEKQDEFKNFLENNIFFKVGDIAMPSPTIIFLPTFVNQDLDTAPNVTSFEVNLAIWNPPTSSIISDIGLDQFKDDYNCSDFDSSQFSE